MGHSVVVKVRSFSVVASLFAVALLVSGLTPAFGDSAQASRLLQQAKSSAAQLSRDATVMSSYSASRVSWQSHAAQIEKIKAHVNSAGKVLDELHGVREGAEPWQQEAIDQITPLLHNLASNTSSIIDHLNDRKQTWHPEYQGYLRSNAEMSSDLSRLIGDYIDYGQAKSRTQGMEKKLGFTGQ